MISISDAASPNGRRSWFERTFRRCILAVLVTTIGVRAAPPATNAAEGRERDLGLGLAYYRIHQLPEDLPASDGPRTPACVVDLRYVRTNGAGAKAFQNWLLGRATARSPVFVLANADTDGAVLAALKDRDPSGGVMLIGSANRNFRPDVAVNVTPEVDRQAYDAFEKGATIASLLNDNPGKIRYDETSLGKDRRAEPPARPAGEGKDVVTPPAVDPVLQRAVHVHRGLLALRKL
jgi:hypothetical protein